MGSRHGFELCQRMVGREHNLKALLVKRPSFESFRPLAVIDKKRHIQLALQQFLNNAMLSLCGYPDLESRTAARDFGQNGGGRASEYGRRHTQAQRRLFAFLEFIGTLFCSFGNCQRLFQQRMHQPSKLAELRQVALTLK